MIIIIVRGYEILTNLIFSQDQWSKIEKYYKYMVNELRNQTNKIIILDITVSIKFQYPIINLSSENMTKIIPKDKNSIFKISIPIYIGEWNHVDREKNHQQIPMISVK